MVNESKAYRKECIKLSIKFATSVILWTCITSNGSIWLNVSHTKRLTLRYINNIFENFSIASPKDLFNDDFIFQYDLASCREFSITNWLIKNQIKARPWLDNSRDLKLIQIFFNNDEKTSRNCSNKQNSPYYQLNCYFRVENNVSYLLLACQIQFLLL